MYLPRYITATVAIAVLATVVNAPAASAVSKIGKSGQSISIASKTVKANTSVVVTGRGFDETIGIYLAYCVLPKSGQAPTPCGGGVNKEGVGDTSLWISSNAPAYGKGLAESFLPGGRFSKKVKVTKNIGSFDCTKVRCAITVRSDHLREGDRSNDLFIPITLKK
jgi:hypothetical protein